MWETMPALCSGLTLACGNLACVSTSFRASLLSRCELKDIPDFDMS